MAEDTTTITEDPDQPGEDPRAQLVPMDAGFILNAIREKYPQCAVVPEVCIHAEEWDEQVPADQRQAYIRRIDALMFDGAQRTAIEIKVSKADFARDTYRKRRPWMLVSHRFIYVTPAGLDVMAPHPCGHWEVHPDGKITIKKRAYGNKYPEPLPQHVITALAHRASQAAAQKS